MPRKAWIFHAESDIKDRYLWCNFVTVRRSFLCIASVWKIFFPFVFRRIPTVYARWPTVFTNDCRIVLDTKFRGGVAWMTGTLEDMRSFLDARRQPGSTPSCGLWKKNNLCSFVFFFTNFKSPSFVSTAFHWAFAYWRIRWFLASIAWTFYVKIFHTNTFVVQSFFIVLWGDYYDGEQSVLPSILQFGFP